MTRTRFHQGLDELKRRLLIMGGFAEQAVDRAIHAYATRDVELCKRVLEDEKAINASEREIDEIAVDLLAMQQPMAVDLRNGATSPRARRHRRRHESRSI